MCEDIKIGIVVADPDELKPFYERVQEYGTKDFLWYSHKGFSFKIKNVEIICLLCGIGKVNAAMAATYLANMECRAILNFGLSGGISGVKRGQLTLADRFLEHDFDLTVIGYKPCEKPHQKYIYEADRNLLDILKANIKDAVCGTAVCGDRFICSETDRQFLKDTFSAVSCDMETAAIASVCYAAEIPFASLRCISDDAGEDACDDYRDMNSSGEDLLFEKFLDGLKAVCENYGR